MKRKAKEYDWTGELVRYLWRRIEEEGWKPRSVSFVADVLYPELPTRFAVELRYETAVGLWGEHCVWIEPDDFCDMYDSVDKFIHRVCGLKYSSPPVS